MHARMQVHIAYIRRCLSSFPAGSVILTVPANSTSHWQLLVVDFYGQLVLSISNGDVPVRYTILQPGFNGTLPNNTINSTILRSVQA